MTNPNARKWALRVVYDMATQSLDRGSCGYADWPEAFEALAILLPEVYGSDPFITAPIEQAERHGLRKDVAHLMKG